MALLLSLFSGLAVPTMAAMTVPEEAQASIDLIMANYPRWLPNQTAEIQAQWQTLMQKLGVYLDDGDLENGLPLMREVLKLMGLKLEGADAAAEMTPQEEAAAISALIVAKYPEWLPNQSGEVQNEFFTLMGKATEHGEAGDLEGALVYLRQVLTLMGLKPDGSAIGSAPSDNKPAFGGSAPKELPSQPTAKVYAASGGNKPVDAANAAGKPYVSLGNMGLGDMFYYNGANQETLMMVAVATNATCMGKLQDESFMAGLEAKLGAKTYEAMMEKIMDELLPQFGAKMDAGDFQGGIETGKAILTALGVDHDQIGWTLESLLVGILLDDFIGNISGIDGAEDYVTWYTGEKEKGVFDYSYYQVTQEAVKKRGLDYITYLWMSTMPEWFKDDPAAERVINALNGTAVNYMSIFAQSTLDAFETHYRETAKNLDIDIIRVGTPYDYGETTYPSHGPTGAIWGVTGVSVGYWVGEESARANFKQTMAAKYGDVGKLNAAWSTSFASFNAIDYPLDAAAPSSRWVLDFVNWYHDGLIGQVGKIVDLSAKYFPNASSIVNLGAAHDKPCIGQSVSGVVKMMAEKDMGVRGVTGTIVPFIMTKLQSTSARHYKPTSFSSEPADGGASLQHMAMSYFKDLTTGVNWHFDYGANLLKAPEFTALFKNYLDIWSKLRGEYPIIEAALFYPMTAHYLENWNRSDAPGFDGGYPTGLREYAEDLRDMLDYDVLDERMVIDGFLKEYRYLIWPIGVVAEAETLTAIKDWVADGGTLLINGVGSIKTVEGSAGAFGELKTGAFGKGKVIEITDKLPDLTEKYPGRLDAADRVYVSEYMDYLLVYNNTQSKVEKTVYDRYGGKTTLSLEALDLRLIPVSAGFTDIAGHWAEAEIKEAASRGLVNGIGGGKFDPDAPLAAEHAYTAFLRAMNVAVDPKAPAAGGANQSAWYAQAVNTAAQCGMLVPGVELEKQMTRIQTAGLIVNALKYLGKAPEMTEAEAGELLKNFTDLGGLSAAERIDLAICVELGIYRGSTDNTFSPGGMLQRAHIASLTVQLQDIILKK